jgi:hypothetical protein
MSITLAEGVAYIDGGSGSTIVGTTNQVTVNTVGNTITLSTPQDIATTSNVTFRSVTAFRPIVSVTGTSRTFALSDANTFQNCNNASSQTLTVPPNSSVAFTIGTEIEVWQQGVGQVSIAAGVGVTLLSKLSHLNLSAQYVGATLKKIATDTWLVVGDLSA